jgi:hypothetical protein
MKQWNQMIEKAIIIYRKHFLQKKQFFWNFDFVKSHSGPRQKREYKIKEKSMEHLLNRQNISIIVFFEEE